MSSFNISLFYKEFNYFYEFNTKKKETNVNFFIVIFPLNRNLFLYGNSLLLNKIFINNKCIFIDFFENIKVTILQALDYLKIKIPRFCYHESLNVAGNCRMCLVELKNSIKPVISCSTLISPGMAVFTDSNLIRDIRKGILEFLLINHPLDCPICDQAGKCDLQDLSFLFGQDISRFYMQKRTVFNIFFNPFVKTVMVRCIHCTRCIRFLTDILKIDGLGIMGRGNFSIISTYVSKTLSHSLVSNVIDLCPVGALISKINTNSYRSWETYSFYFLDILDPFLKIISVELCGNKILDILPIVSNINSFITDRTRYLWDSFQSFRLVFSNVSVKFNIYYNSISYLLYKFFFSFFYCYLFSNYYIFSLDYLSIKESFFLSFFFNNFLNINHSNSFYYNNFIFDQRNFFINNYDYINFFNLIIGFNLNQESPLFISLFNKMNNDMKSIFYFFFFDFDYTIKNSIQLGFSNFSFNKFVEGRFYKSELKNELHFNFLFNSTLNSLFSKLKLLNFFNNSDFFCIRNFGLIHKEEIGFSFNFSIFNSFLYKKNIAFIKFFINSIKINRKFNSIFNFDLHSEKLNKLTSLKVDIGCFNLFEKTGKFINTKGIIKSIIGKNYNTSINKNLFIFIDFIKKFLNFFILNDNDIKNRKQKYFFYYHKDNLYLNFLNNLINNGFLYLVFFEKILNFFDFFFFSQSLNKIYFLLYINTFSIILQSIISHFYNKSLLIFNTFLKINNIGNLFFSTYVFNNIIKSLLYIERDVFSHWSFNLKKVDEIKLALKKKNKINSFFYFYNNSLIF